MIVNPTKVFWNTITPYIDDKEFIAFHEPTVYLIEEEIWDETAMLEKYLKKILHQEIIQLTDDVRAIPIVSTADDVLAMFTLTFGSTIVDCLKSPIDKL